MEVEFIANGLSEDGAFEVANNVVQDGSTFEGERCGICMDIIIDRGVLDCCQHWFCFACIDNWATITNLCPLCQNEFQLITCVPVYDTIGGSKDEEDSFSRDDDWCIEGKNNTLSFPSYYIDENAVICLDGDGCKIRSGSATIREDSNLDTSIACDSCDLWYHAFCVGFDPEGTYENTWLCPRCVVDEFPQKLDVISMQRPDNHCGPGKVDNESLGEDTFSGKMSVSVVDAGETAVIVSMVGKSKLSEEPRENFLSTLEVDNDLKKERIMSNTDASSPKADTQLTERNGSQPTLESEELELSLAHDGTSILSPNALVLSKLKTTCADEEMNEASSINGAKFSPRKLFKNELSESKSCIGLHLGLSVSSFLSVDNKSGGTIDQVTEAALQNPLEESLLKADKIVPEANDATSGLIGVKRKHTDSSDYVHLCANNGETKDKIETEVPAKKTRAEGKIQRIPSRDDANASDLDDSQKCPTLIAVSIDKKLKHHLKRKDITSDIMTIVHGTSHRASKELGNQNPDDKSSEERESAAGLRVKKIMRRPAEDNKSSMVVQKLGKEIREAIRNNSSKDIGEHIFDPKLLAAFRAAVAGPKAEPVKKLSPVAVKAKTSMLQKGKIRENLTKKIYASANGRRKRAWDRDCEVEFWKHRCIRASKPEKIETLKSVLDHLRKSSESSEIGRGPECQATNPILSRLYLADTSVFPRKDDIKPLSVFKATDNSEQNTEQSISVAKGLKPSVDNQAVKNTETNKDPSKVGISLINGKGNKKNVSSSKGNAASGKEHPNRHPEGPALSPLSGSKVNSQKGMVVKSDDTKSDKRKWALEILARKTAATSMNSTHEKHEDSAVLKGNYPLLAQLPIEMIPVLAPSRHNKIPISVRKTQLYRLTEHFLRKANLPVIRRTADTELAVADATNIEKEVADRSNSKLVYVNLCSQELLRRSANSKSSNATELNPLPQSAGSVDGSEQDTCELPTDSKVVEALRTAGLLSDSPPNSPLHGMEVPNEEEKALKTGEEEPDNILEMDTLPELDIYGDFEYDLGDEDYIGAAVKVSKIQPEEGVSKVKVLFSTLNSEKSNSALHAEGECLGTVERPKDLPVLECGTDAGIGSSRMENETDNLCATPQPLLGLGGEEPSAAECEELYGPDKEPLIKKIPEEASRKLFGTGAEDLAENKLPGSDKNIESNQVVEVSEFESQTCEDTNIVATVGHCSSGGENSPNHSQAGENVQRKEKKSSTDTEKQPHGVNIVSKKVEAYIKEHIRPLCKSGVITAEQYRWAVAKTTEKVMKYHTKAKNANFLIKEGEKVKKLAEQYVEAAQK